jgi:hypothetical protein
MVKGPLSEAHTHAAIVRVHPLVVKVLGQELEDM